MRNERSDITTWYIDIKRIIKKYMNRFITMNLKIWVKKIPSHRQVTKSNSRNNKKGEQLYIYDIETIINSLPTKKTLEQNLAGMFYHTKRKKDY